MGTAYDPRHIVLDKGQNPPKTGSLHPNWIFCSYGQSENYSTYLSGIGVV